LQRLRTLSLTAVALASMTLGTGVVLAQPADKAPDQQPAPQGDAEDGQTPALGDSDAPTAQDIENARQAFIEGNQLFQAKDYPNAIIKFKEAYRLSRNPLLLYNIGFTLDLNKETDLALFYYEKFLTDAGPKAQVYDEVKARVEAIKKAKEAGSVFDTGSMGKIEEPARPQVTEFQHKVVEETPPGKPLDITAFIPEGSGWQVTLYFRAAGEERFDSTLMKPRYNELVGRIPATKTRGASLQYYIEVRDKTGKIVERSGRSASPNLVFVDPGAQPRYYPDLEREIQIEDTTRATSFTPQGTPETGTPGSGGFSDVQSGTYQVAKWGVTGATVGMVGLWLTFNISAANMARSLEDEATRSTMTDDCPSEAPCRAFSDYQKGVQTLGKRYETLANVSLTLSVVSAGVTGYLWYREISTRQRQKRSAAAARDSDSKVTAVPVVGPDFVGGAAHLSF
jgi:tetratricopeptide (TPR) repeat protein